MKYYAFSSLLLKSGWLSPAYVGVDEQGLIQYLAAEPPTAPDAIVEKVAGAALPGFQNAHSHAFQYGMAGHAEQHESGTRDDFWSWREAMYACAETFSPEQNEQVATTLYRHLLRNGYTSVVEFHYLHHDPTGRPYANLAEMGERLVAAARTAGIKITLVPVFYQKGDFGREPQPRGETARRVRAVGAERVDDLHAERMRESLEARHVERADSLGGALRSGHSAKISLQSNLCNGSFAIVSLHPASIRGSIGEAS